ncbi:hypothetical protein NUACC21_23280 [Scytonema sp. NUACC21]
MLNVPLPISEYIISFLIEKRSLAYLLISKDGYISAWGGQWSAFGFTNLQKGEKVGKQFFFLEGLLPLEDSPLFFPFMKTASGMCADVHLFPSKEGDWVVLLDATWDEIYVAVIQQQANSSSLERQSSTQKSD